MAGGQRDPAAPAQHSAEEVPRHNPWITLTTDFGTGSPYVGAMKGVILSYHPEARLVDITHEVPPQNIRMGAIILADATPYFPPGTIHVVVVDPGVGTERALVYAELGTQRYLAPDNGVLSLVMKRSVLRRVIQLRESRFWRREISATFHGRDILGPVAAQLARGLDSALLGPPHPALKVLEWPEPAVFPELVEGQVIAVDSFGNLITNIEERHIAGLGPRDQLQVESGRWIIDGLSRTYGEHPPGQLVSLIGSSGRLEVAVVCGNAAAVTGLDVDASVRIRPKR